MNKKVKTKKKINRFDWGGASSEAWKKATSDENIGGTMSGIAGAATGLIGTAMQNAQIDASAQEAELERVKAQSTVGSSLDSIQNMWQNTMLADTNITASDVRGMSAGQMASNTLGSIASGASAGASVGGPWGCVCAGTRVITNNGKIVNIEDLKQEEGILGFDKNVVKNSIFAFKPIDYKECVKITLSNGLFLECSTDHPIYTAKQGRANRKTLNGVRKRIKEYSFVEAKDLKVGDNIGCVMSVPYFGKEQLPNAYLIGMLIGDGSYGKNKPVRLYTGDVNTWEYIEKNNLGVCIYKDTYRYSKEFRIYRILEGCSLLRSVGIYGQTKLNKTLPCNIHDYDKNSICNLLAGLFDTDGCVCYNENNPKNSKIEFSQSNLKLIKDIQEQLIKLGIYSYLKISKPRTSIINNREVFSKENYKLVIKDKESVINFYNNIHLNIDYKQQHLELLYKYKANKHSKNNLESGVRNCKIIKIENIGVKPIYNLQADDSHTYIANFIITHNSVAGAVVGLGTSLAGIFTGNAKARRKARELNKAGLNQNDTMLANVSGNIDNVVMNEINQAGVNRAAYGGPLHDFTGDFTNGITFINEGGTHEQNPFEGVMVGVDNEGTPNLVEEGEVIWNDYVFSDRLKPTKKQLKDGGYTKYEDWTFAKIAEDFQKASAETPNDKIAIDSLNDRLEWLVNIQEDVRIKKQMNKDNKENTFAFGGEFGNILQGDGNRPNYKKNPALNKYINSMNTNLTYNPDIYKGFYADSFITPTTEVNATSQNTPALTALSPITPIIGSYIPEYTSENPIDKIAKLKITDPKKYVKEYLTPTIDESSEDFNWQSLGRYAPVITSAASLLNNVFQEPDYSNANAGLIAMQNVPTIKATPIGGKQQYTPVDRNYLLNKQLNASRAASRDIQNQATTRSQALAHLANQNYNTQTGIADALIGIERENLARKMQTAQFNLGIDQFNTQQDMQAQMANQQRGYNIAQAATNAGQLREAINAQRGQAISADMSGLASDLAGIGTEAEHKAWLDNLVKTGAIEDYLKAARTTNSSKNGGRLLTKKRK